MAAHTNQVVLLSITQNIIRETKLIDTQYGQVYGARWYHLVTLHVHWTSINGDSWGHGDIGTLPVGWRPMIKVWSPYAGRDGGSQRAVVIDTNGTMKYENHGGAQNTGIMDLSTTYVSA